MDPNLHDDLLAAYQQLLTPLIRILLRNNVGFHEFAEISKFVFVDAARALHEQTTTSTEMTSKISAVTGLSVPEVTILLENRATDKARESNLSKVIRILSGWHTDNRFTGPYGLPLELPFSDPNTADFLELVEQYCPGTDARSLLDELIRVGVVKETESNWLKVLTRTYVPKTDAPASIERLGKAVANFVETIDHNRIEPDPEHRLFERIVKADNGIHKEDLPKLKSYIRERAQLLLEEIDNWLSQLPVPSTEDSRQVVQTGLGIYHYVEK